MPASRLYCGCDIMCIVCVLASSLGHPGSARKEDQALVRYTNLWSIFQEKTWACYGNRGEGRVVHLLLWMDDEDARKCVCVRENKYECVCACRKHCYTVAQQNSWYLHTKPGQKNYTINLSPSLNLWITFDNSWDDANYIHVLTYKRT